VGWERIGGGHELRKVRLSEDNPWERNLTQLIDSGNRQMGKSFNFIMVIQASAKGKSQNESVLVQWDVRCQGSLGGEGDGGVGGDELGSLERR